MSIKRVDVLKSARRSCHLAMLVSRMRPFLKARTVEVHLLSCTTNICGSRLAGSWKSRSNWLGSRVLGRKRRSGFFWVPLLRARLPPLSSCIARRSSRGSVDHCRAGATASTSSTRDPSPQIRLARFLEVDRHYYFFLFAAL